MKKQQKKTSAMTPKPQLEALLHLKRSEKPDAQFWERFDSELHQRMLQTLVKKEPWYRQSYYAFLRPKVQLFLAASLATAWVCIFGWQPLEVDNPKSRLASNDVVFDIANQGDVEGPYAKSMDFTPVMATQLFNLESSFPLTGLVEGAQEFTLERQVAKKRIGFIHLLNSDS